MSVRTETLQLRVLVDGTPARRELATLDQEYAKLNSGLKDLKRNSKEWQDQMLKMDGIKGRQAELRKEIGDTALSAKQLTDELKRLQVVQRNATPNTEQWVANAARIEQLKQRLRELNDVNVRATMAWEQQRKSIKLTDMSMAQLEQESRRLRAALSNINPNTADFRAYRRELALVEARTKELQTGMSGFGRAWQSIKGQVAGGIATAGAFIGITQLIGGVKQLVTGSGELSDELANMQKATGKTAGEVRALDADLRNIDTRTARSELRGIAIGLGQAGEEASAAAVAAVDKINVALGDEFGAEAKDITTTLTQMRNNLSDIKSGDYADDVGRIGNALNVLGANGLATAPVVSDITSRIAGSGRVFKIASGDILGTAATFQELAINTERGSTAYVRILQKIASEPKKFAAIVKAAGGDVDLFNKQVNEDMQAAFVTVARSARIAGTDNTAFAQVLADMETEGVGVTELLSKIGANEELLAAKSKLATEALTSQDSITEEFNIKNNTLGANLNKVGKALMGAFVNSGVSSAINSIVRNVANWIDTPLSETLEKDRMEMQKLYAQILITNEGSKERVKLIQEMQAKYPAYLGNIDAETISNERLGMAVAALNTQLANKIVLQKKDEQIQAQIETQAEKQMAVLKMEDELRERMVKLAEKNGITLGEAGSLIEQAQGVLAGLRAAENPAGPKGRAFSSSAGLANEIRELQIAYSLLNSEQKVSNTLANERKELLTRLGIVEWKALPVKMEVEPVVEGAGGTGTGTGTEDADKAADELARTQQAIAEARERIFQDGLSADERDLRQLDVKHKTERDAVLANKLHTEADLRALDEAQERERANLIEAQGEERLKGYSEAAEKIRLATLSAGEKQLEDEMRKWDALIALAKKYGIDSTELEEARLKALAVINDKADKDADKKFGERTKAAITKEREALQQRIALVQEFGSLAQSVASYMDAVSAAEEARADSDGLRTEAEKARIADLNEQRKQAALIAIAVQGAAAIANGVASAMAAPNWVVGVGQALATVGIVIGLMAQAKALMNQGLATPSPTTTSQGSGFSAPLGEKGGVFEGPSHAEDGLKVVNPKSGQIVAEVEGGEPWMVLSKLFRRNNPGLVRRLLQASATGERLNMADRGGIFRPVPAFNFTRATEAIKMAQGGVVGGLAPRKKRHQTHGSALVNMPTAPGSGGGDEMMALLKVIAQNTAATVAATNKRRSAVVSLKQLQEKEAEQDYLTDRTTVKRLPTGSTYTFKKGNGG